MRAHTQGKAARLAGAAGAQGLEALEVERHPAPLGTTRDQGLDTPATTPGPAGCEEPRWPFGHPWIARYTQGTANH